MNRVQRWEIVGIFVIVGFGTTLHFWFEWTDYWRPIALIAAVNESTWEHFKMAFWPGLLFALIEYPFLKDETNNFFVAKFTGLFAMPVITTILFYGYTSLTILTKTEKMQPSAQNFAIAGLVIMVLAFSLLSYFPLKNFLFSHPETGEIGILSDYDHDHDNDH